MPDKSKKSATLEDLLDAVSEVLFGTDLYRELTPEEEAQAREILAELTPEERSVRMKSIHNQAANLLKKVRT